MEEAIKSRIAELDQSREQIVTSANQSIAALNGKIEELNRLIAPKVKAVPIAELPTVEAPAAEPVPTPIAKIIEVPAV